MAVHRKASARLWGRAETLAYQSVQRSAFLGIYPQLLNDCSPAVARIGEDALFELAEFLGHALVSSDHG